MAEIVSINPHNQSVVGEMPVSTPAEIAAAVSSARDAFPGWKATPIQERIDYIKKFKQILIDNSERLATLVSQEMGKPLNQSRDDITAELSFLDYYTNASESSLADETVLKDDSGHFRLTYEPVGVVACISPWNFPLSMVTSGVIPALIAGNTVVAKPSEYTTLSQKLVIDMINESGLPAGVLTGIIGGRNEGELLTDEPIDLIWFTGSTRAGQAIYEKAGKKFIRALLEMGGSSPGIIFANADLDNALEQIYWARFLNAGQVCTSVKRLFVERSIFDLVVDGLKTKLETLKLDNPMNSPDVGPLVTTTQLTNLEAQVADAINKGANLVCGGARPSDSTLATGNYYLPTLLTYVTSDMKVMTEEVFGPALPLIPFETEAEAISLANQTEYGLSAEVYTTDPVKAERVAKQLDAGTVAINTDNFFKPECPFGGFKKSGLGKEYGIVGIREFTRQKVIAISK